MTVVVTKNQLAEIDSRVLGCANIDLLVSSLNATMTRFDINSSLRRVRFFITQTMYESAGFTKLVENLFYTTPTVLVNVWPSRFSMTRGGNKAYAPDYVKNPQKLANLVYAGRYGNSGPNDGWKYRGRGAMHLTFKDNYRNASLALYKDNRLVDQPDLVENDMSVASDTAGWFWNVNKLNALADSDEFTRVTTIINGSAATVPKRLEVLRIANRVII